MKPILAPESIDLIALAPVLVLSVFAMGVLVLDLWAGKNKTLVMFVSLVGLLMTAISAFAKELERRRLSEKQGQVLTQRFVWAMNDTLKEQSLKNNWVIVPQTSVYAGVSDKTDAMLKLIAQKMKKEPAKRDLSRKLQRSTS